MQIYQPSILKGRSHFVPFCLSWPECPDQLEGVARALWQGHARGSQRFWSSVSHRVAVLMLFTPLSLAGVLGVCRSHTSPGRQCFVPADAQLELTALLETANTEGRESRAGPWTVCADPLAGWQEWGKKHEKALLFFPKNCVAMY